MATAKTYGIRKDNQLAVLAAAARQEIVDVLEQMGTVSVAELAAALNRPADALYFHLRALTRVGLVQQAGYRPGRNRQEALYRTVAPELQLQYDPQDAANRKRISAIVNSMLRLATRDFRRSFQPGNVVVSGAHRELWALRKVGRLSRGELARLNSSIKGVAEKMSAPRRQGRLYAITVILTPLDHRNNVDGLAKVKQKRTKEGKRR